MQWRELSLQTTAYIKKNYSVTILLLIENLEVNRGIEVTGSSLFTGNCRLVTFYIRCKVQRSDLITATVQGVFFSRET